MAHLNNSEKKIEEGRKAKRGNKKRKSQKIKDKIINLFKNKPLYKKNKKIKSNIVFRKSKLKIEGKKLLKKGEEYTIFILTTLKSNVSFYNLVERGNILKHTDHAGNEVGAGNGNKRRDKRRGSLSQHFITLLNSS